VFGVVTGLHVGKRKNRGSVLDKGKRIPLLENFQTETEGHTTSSATNLG
jgi:hypothetical protein